MDFHVVNYSHAAQTVMDRLAIDLSVTLNVFDEIPPANDGGTRLYYVERWLV